MLTDHDHNYQRWEPVAGNTSVAADDSNRVYVVAKASLNDPAEALAQSPLVTGWLREPAGEWRSATAWTVADDVTGPQLMVDPVLRQVATYWHSSVVVER